MRLESLAVHAGAEPDAATGAVAPPLHLSTTFAHGPAAESIAGFEYARGGNPTQYRLQNALALLEGGTSALAFASGMAAADAMLCSLPPGSRILIPRDVYHGVRTLAAEVLPRMGIHADSIDMTDAQAVAAALTPATRCVWLETPSNPLLEISDIAAIAAIAHRNGAVVVVDNTFATPCLQLPLALGADVVMHSTTKYFGGHSDVMGGALIFAQNDARCAAIARARLVRGAVMAPFNAWLTLRGLRSLPARMAWHCRNARAVAEFLAAHPRVEAVHWPGLAKHPNHAIAARQMRDFGGMLSVQIRGGRQAALDVAGKVKLFINATSLGGCESLIEHRASVEGTNPVSPDNLLRLSVGVEHADDLVADLEQALRN
ncbi:MAG: trans-sulfuration enzyme family protein [Rudaea sp.]